MWGLFPIYFVATKHVSALELLSHRILWSVPFGFLILAFIFAARRIKLSALGILQFVGPTLQFACGLYYGETFTRAHAFCFGFIWLGVGVFAFDAIRAQKHQDQAVSH